MAEEKSAFEAQRAEDENKLSKALALKDCTTGQLESLTRVAEQAERFEEMALFMKCLIDKRLTKKEQLSGEERNFFSVAYKNVVGGRRTSWRTTNETIIENGKNELLVPYKSMIAGEIQTLCLEIQGILKKVLEVTESAITVSEAAEKAEKDKDGKDKDGGKAAKQTSELHDSWIFYSKMIGDYYRYLREVFPKNDEYKKLCEKHYQAAMDRAEEKQEPTNPTRLGLALNFSVCHFEILQNQQAACDLAKSAFDQAIEKLDSLNDASYKDSTLIMQLLRDNLTIWKTKDEEVAQ